jgi:two-component system invasion response regulator UvrY
VSHTAGPAHESLSNREYEVLCLLARARSVKEIGRELGLSEKTVSTYRARLLGKLQMRTTADLIRYAIQNGLVD